MSGEGVFKGVVVCPGGGGVSNWGVVCPGVCVWGWCALGGGGLCLVRGGLPFFMRGLPFFRGGRGSPTFVKKGDLPNMGYSQCVIGTPPTGMHYCYI